MNSSEDIAFSVDISNDKRRSSLKTRDVGFPRDQSNDYSNAINRKSVVWDVKSLGDQELEKTIIQKKKFNESKAHYIPYEEGTDEYWSKLNQINQIQPTKEFLEQLSGAIEQKSEMHRPESQCSTDEYSDENTKDEDVLNKDEETLKNTLYNKFAGQVGN